MYLSLFGFHTFHERDKVPLKLSCGLRLILNEKRLKIKRQIT
jgi:hypothetical protein